MVPFKGQEQESGIRFLEATVNIGCRASSKSNMEGSRSCKQVLGVGGTLQNFR